NSDGSKKKGDKGTGKYLVPFNIVSTKGVPSEKQRQQRGIYLRSLRYWMGR
ncbi:hypothetical protein MKX03_030378, partial [Papaver bracteatum]